MGEEKSCNNVSHLSHKSKINNALFNTTYYHILADFIQDVILLVLSIGIKYYPSLTIIDPFLSLIISTFVIIVFVKLSLTLCKRLMEMTPSEIDYNKVLNCLLEINGVKEIHDLHIWDVGEKKFVATTHIVAEDESVLKEATLVFRKFKIFHSTVQIENSTGKNEENFVNCDNNIHC